MKKAIVLLSGGMDSAVTLYMAKETYECHCLIFDYGQKAASEIKCAKKIAEVSKAPFYVLEISLPWKGSALLDEAEAVPEGSASAGGAIPATYVPSRNIIMLSFGTSFAEAIDADAVFIGAHQLDYSNYPDCRGEFFESFQESVRRGTKKGTRGRGIKIETPIINKTKKEIIEIGSNLGVPFGNTWSCYIDGDKPCGICESCLLRSKAFGEAGIEDPLTAKNL